jgi:hypothetical protein
MGEARRRQVALQQGNMPELEPPVAFAEESVDAAGVLLAQLSDRLAVWGANRTSVLLRGMLMQLRQHRRELLDEAPRIQIAQPGDVPGVR